MIQKRQKIKDYIGKKLGTLTLIKITNRKNINNAPICKFKCDCGKIIFKTVGAARYMKKGCGWNCKIFFPDLTGQTFGKLTVIKKYKRNKRTKYKVKCLCGKLKIVNDYDLKLGKTKSCGCGIAEAARLRRGINSPSYKHGIRCNRETPQYKEWVLNIKQRDNFCCQICLSKIKIEAHHINSYSLYPSDRFKINNGITLCRKCHRKFHSIYGLSSASRQNFIEFLLLIEKGFGHITKIKSNNLLSIINKLEKEYLENIGNER